MARPDIRLTPDEQVQFLRENRKCALATLDPHGFPHIVAMNFIFRDGAFYMTSYGKAQKVLNVRRDPKVAVMIETGAAYSELRGVMARGHCELMEGEEAVREVFGWMAAARNTHETAARPTTASNSAPKRVVMKIVPVKIVTWDHGKLGGRY